MNFLSIKLICGVAVAGLPCLAPAAIVFENSVQTLPAANFWYSKLEKSDTHLLAFDEAQRVALPNGKLEVQVLNQWDDTDHLVEVALSPDALVSSHMVYFQKAASKEREKLVAEVEFDQPVIGFLGDGYLFGVSNQWFAPNTTHRQPAAKPNTWSLEEEMSWTPLDRVTLLTPTRIRIEFTNHSAMDPLRVYTLAEGKAEPMPVVEGVEPTP